MTFQACRGVRIAGNEFDSHLLGRNILLEAMERADLELDQPELRVE